MNPFGRGRREIRKQLLLDDPDHDQEEGRAATAPAALAATAPAALAAPRRGSLGSRGSSGSAKGTLGRGKSLKLQLGRTYTYAEIQDEQFMVADSPSSRISENNNGESPSQSSLISKPIRRQSSRVSTVQSVVQEQIASSRGAVLEIGKLPCGFSVMDPRHSSFLLVWDVLVGLLLCIVAVEAPFETVFVKPSLGILFTCNRIVDLVFLTDLMLQFVTAQEDPHHPGLYERHPRALAVIYLRTWFAIDFLSILPVDILCVLSETEGGLLGFDIPRGLRNVKVLRLMRLTRLLRLAKMQRLLVRWRSSWSLSFAVQSLIQFMVMIVIVSHWMACLWASVAWSSDGTSWISELQVEDGSSKNDMFYVYSVSLYWAVMTLTSIGYGDIVATNHGEYVVATLCMLFMAGIWAYTIGGVCGIVASLEPHEVLFRRTMDDLNNMMHDSHMPHEVRTKLRKYLYASRSVHRRKAEVHLVNSLSPMLQGEILLYGNKEFLMVVPYFQQFTHEELVCAAQCSEAKAYAPTEYIHQEKTLFIVQQGLCLRLMQVLIPRTTWGQSNLVLSNPMLWDPEGAYALTHVQVLTLRATELDTLLDRFPTARSSISRARLCMGVSRACQIMKDLEAEVMQSKWKGAWEQLEEEGRLMLWTDLLRGRFRAPMLNLYVPSPLEDDGYVSRSSGRLVTTVGVDRRAGDVCKKLSPKQEAERMLTQAMESRGVPQLRSAVQRAQQASVDASLVERAERALREEMLFESIRELGDQIHTLRMENSEMRSMLRSKCGGSL